MPSVKIPRKSTWTDMTPFVDVAFLILAFFIMATKFKPPEAVEITTPKSVSSDKLKEKDAMVIEVDKEGRVFFSLNLTRPEDHENKKSMIRNVSDARNLGLTDAEVDAYAINTVVGVPFNRLKQYLATPEKEREYKIYTGIPVDSANNELSTWVANAIHTFQRREMDIRIKGDNNAKYPVVKGVIDALKRNELFKYQLVTEPETVPAGTDLYLERTAGRSRKEES